ncbi:MAG: hypothetical protein ACFWTJ_06635 [Lachnoclostridium sp.]|jgi:MoxR-like ATPase
MAKANAFIFNRDYVIPDDVKMVFRDVASHRMILKPKARLNDLTMAQIMDMILQQVRAPKIT